MSDVSVYSWKIKECFDLHGKLHNIASSQQNSVVSRGTPVYEMQDFSFVLSLLKLPKNKKGAKK